MRELANAQPSSVKARYHYARTLAETACVDEELEEFGTALQTDRRAVELIAALVAEDPSNFGARNILCAVLDSST